MWFLCVVYLDVDSFDRKNSYVGVARRSRYILIIVVMLVFIEEVGIYERVFSIQLSDMIA